MVSTLEIITPSYNSDFSVCALLSESIQIYAPPGTVHRVIVPSKDLPRFSTLADEFVEVQAVEEVLPRHFVKVAGLNWWLNIKRPWPPMRGWIVQQIVKLAAAASSSAEIALLVDSDVTFIRPFSSADYSGSSAIPLYRLESAIHQGMNRHLVWDRVARQMLGLSPEFGPPNDYICCPCAWRPEVVQSLLDYVSAKSGHHWSTTVGNQLHFSEMVLYGLYVDNIASAHNPVEIIEQMSCANYFDEVPLDQSTFDEFLDKVKQNDRAVMISAKSGTPMSLRRQILSAFRD